MEQIRTGTNDNRLQRRDRHVVAAGELTEAEIALIAQAEVPAERPKST